MTTNGTVYASPALRIHDEVFKRLSAPGAFNGVVNFKTIRRTIMRRFQKEQLPALAVYLLTDDGRAKDETLAGEPYLDSDLQVSVQILMIDTDDDVLFLAMEQALAAALRLLLNDGSFMLTGPAAIHNGVNRLIMRRLFNQIAEVPLAQITAEIHFRYLWDWPPIELDDLLQIQVTSSYPPGADPAKVMQIERTYDLSQTG